MLPSYFTETMLKVIENSAIGSGICQQQYWDPTLKD